MKKKVKFLIGTGMLLGVGTVAVGKVGGSTAGLGAAASFMPTIGTLTGAGMVVEQTKKLGKIKRKI